MNLLLNFGSGAYLDNRFSTRLASLSIGPFYLTVVLESQLLSI